MKEVRVTLGTWVTLLPGVEDCRIAAAQVQTPPPGQCESGLPTEGVRQERLTSTGCLLHAVPHEETH